MCRSFAARIAGQLPLPGSELTGLSRGVMPIVFAVRCRCRRTVCSGDAARISCTPCFRDSRVRPALR